MMLQWKDVTSFSRDDKDRTPRSWEIRTEHMRVLVHRHRHYPDRWLLSVYGTLQIEDFVLAALNVDVAKTEALNRVRRLLAELQLEITEPGKDVEILEVKR